MTRADLRLAQTSASRNEKKSADFSADFF